MSELAKPRPSARTLRAFDDNFEDVRIASVVLHEVRYGIERLPDGKRKDVVRAAMDVVVNGILVLPYDAPAAEWHATERSRLEALGHVPAFADGLIAATAAAHGCTLVTANARDFRSFAITIESWA